MYASGIRLRELPVIQLRMSRLETGTMLAGIIACVGNNTLSTADPTKGLLLTGTVLLLELVRVVFSFRVCRVEQLGLCEYAGLLRVCLQQSVYDSESTKGFRLTGIIACVGNNTLSTADPVEIAAFRYYCVCRQQYPFDSRSNKGTAAYRCNQAYKLQYSNRLWAHHASTAPTTLATKVNDRTAVEGCF
jgi:hypothetical protein